MISNRHSVRPAALRQADSCNLSSRVFNAKWTTNAARSRDCGNFTFDYLFFFFERGGFAIEFSILSVKLVPYFSEVFSRKSCCETNVTLKNGNEFLFFFFFEFTFSFKITLLNNVLLHFRKNDGESSIMQAILLKIIYPQIRRLKINNIILLNVVILFIPF